MLRSWSVSHRLRFSTMDGRRSTKAISLICPRNLRSNFKGKSLLSLLSLVTDISRSAVAGYSLQSRWLNTVLSATTFRWKRVSIETMKTDTNIVQLFSFSKLRVRFLFENTESFSAGREANLKPSLHFVSTLHRTSEGKSVQSLP